jgi:hypothetical protein
MTTCRPADPGPHPLGLGGEPAARLNRVPTEDDVDDLRRLQPTRHRAGRPEMLACTALPPIGIESGSGSATLSGAAAQKGVGMFRNGRSGSR